jgi:hypothetical protein
MKGWKHKKTPTIVGNEKTPTKMESGQVIINKKATKENLNKLIEINNDGLDTEKSKVSTDGTEGGILKGKPHYDKNGKSLGGIPVVVDGAKKIEVEGDEFVVNKEASQKHWKELSKINQSAGNGVPINPSDVGADTDPEEFKAGGKIIEFNPNDLPSSWIYSYGKKIKEKYPKVWDMGGNIFGNEAFVNLERVIKRGYWKDSEEWMYIKWRSYVARHHKDFRIEGTVAMLKWVDKTDKGWDYMKSLIKKEIDKKYPKKGFKNKMAYGGGVKDITCKCGWGWNKNQSEKHDEYVCHKCGTDNKMKYGGELAKGIKIEAEHQNTFKKVYAHKLTPMQAPVEVAKEHLKEDKNYYSKLGKMEKFNTGGAATVIEDGDIVRGEYFPGIYGNFEAMLAGADAVKVRNLLTSEESIKDYRDFTLFLKKGTNKVTTSSPAKSSNIVIKIPKSYISSTSTEAETLKDFEVGDVIRTRYDNWPNIDDYESANNLAEVTKKTLNADGEYEYDIKGNNSKYTGRYLGKSLELAVERTVANKFKFEIGDKVIYTFLNEVGTIKDREIFAGVKTYSIILDNGNGNSSLVPEQDLDKFKFEIGDKVIDKTNSKVAIIYDRFLKDGFKKYTIIIDGEKFTGEDEENLEEIVTLEKGQPTMPMPNLPATDIKPTEPTKPKFVPMDFTPFLDQYVNSNFKNVTNMDKKEIVRQTIQDYILDVEAVDNNQNITFKKEAEILDKLDNYIN